MPVHAQLLRQPLLLRPRLKLDPVSRHPPARVSLQLEFEFVASHGSQWSHVLLVDPRAIPLVGYDEVRAALDEGAVRVLVRPDWVHDRALGALGGKPLARVPRPMRHQLMEPVAKIRAVDPCQSGVVLGEVTQEALAVEVAVKLVFVAARIEIRNTRVLAGWSKGCGFGSCSTH